MTFADVVERIRTRPTNQRVVVLGGGLVGQLAGFLFPEARVLDRRPAPVNPTQQPGAFYLWEKLAGLSCSPLIVMTQVDNAPATGKSVAAYKEKVGEPFPTTARAYGNGPSYRPHQFDQYMVGHRIDPFPPVNVEWNVGVDRVDVRLGLIMRQNGPVIPFDLLINTIPLDAFLRLCEPRVASVDLRCKPIFLKVDPSARVPTPQGMDLLYVNYVSSPAVPYYRETYDYRANVRTREYLTGDSTMIRVTPGKLVAHSAVPSILERLHERNIVCFGHNATWDPDELTHHTWEKLLAYRGATNE